MELRSKKLFSELNVGRMLMYACGFTDSEMGKPLVGVINAFSEIVPGHMNLRTLADMAKAGVRMAGGVPIEFPCISLCDGIATGRYQMASRNLIADSIEICIESHLLDGMVLLGGCDKIIPGQLMAMARLNVPSIMVTAGPMLPGCYEGKPFALSDYVDRRMDHILGKRELSPLELRELRAEAFPTVGSCQGMYTANSMAIVAEALGVTLPRCSTVHAVDSRKLELAKDSGAQVMSLIAKDIRPKSILTRQAFENAVRVAISVGASTNLCTHIPAIAKEIGVELHIDDFDRLSRSTPQLSNMCPAGEHMMLDLDRAGGVGAVMSELGTLLHKKVMTVTGKTLAENIERVEVKNRNVIRPMGEPVNREGGLVVLRGTLAPAGAIARSSSFPPHCLAWEGNAKCFSSAEEAAAAIQSGRIMNRDIVVVRYEGLKGGPGAREINLVPYLLNALGHEHLGMITDGRLSGSNRGAIVCHVSPEAYEGGPLALVEDGDRILIDIDNRKLDLLVEEDELKTRLKSWKRPERGNLLNYMQRYRKEVTSLHEGGIQE